MGTPTIHGHAPTRSLWARELFPDYGWAVHSAASLARSGSVVTLALGARPLASDAGPPSPLPAWAVPLSAVALDLKVPSTGIVPARLLISSLGTIAVYGVTVSASWAYGTVSWIIPD